ncbi:hypothetical protein BC941DRAFT_407332 [Chlamydoabsidia padenii]|nr:hypothetical protein BC941DRAFT_407332 [Chlamydoabsidia padenii]
MDLAVFPPEITQIILEFLPIKDLIRAERTSKLLQVFCLSEIERRIKTGSLKDEFGVLIHLGQAQAQPQQFDPITKTVQYTIPMDPITINTMYDHRRNIHCSLLRKQPMIEHAASTTKKINYLSQHGFTIPLEKGMTEGKTVQISVDNALCQLDASLTRLESPNSKADKKLSLAPVPLSYSLQVTSMRLPLSTIAASS